MNSNEISETTPLLVDDDDIEQINEAGNSENETNVFRQNLKKQNSTSSPLFVNNIHISSENSDENDPVTQVKFP